MYLNKAMLYGNLTKNPELKQLPSGSAVVNFSVATNRTYKDKNGQKVENVDYHNVVAFGRTAEVIQQYMTKGSAIFIEGRIQTRSYDAKDGTKRYVTEIVTENMQFGPSRGPRQDQSDGGSQESPVEYPDDQPEPTDINDLV